MAAMPIRAEISSLRRTEDQGIRVMLRIIEGPVGMLDRKITVMLTGDQVHKLHESLKECQEGASGLILDFD